MYYTGIGVKKSNKTAFKWYTKAAENDHALAQYALATMYLEGKGVKQSYKDAFKWMKEAAEQGVRSAQYDLSLMYHYGTGVKKSNKEAFKWMRLVADDLFDETEEWDDEYCEVIPEEEVQE